MNNTVTKRGNLFYTFHGTIGVIQVLKKNSINIFNCFTRNVPVQYIKVSC